MEWASVGEWLKSNAGTGASLVGSLLTGNVPGAVAAGVALVSSATGTNDPTKALEALQTDPATMVRLRELAVQDEASIREHVRAMAEMQLLDVQSARTMQIAALGQDDIFSKRFVYYFAAAWSLFSMAYFIGVTFWPPPLDGQRIADTILGVLIASVIGVMFAYFYGSTKGSAEKTRLLAQSTMK